jgi:hypothetical protein
MDLRRQRCARRPDCCKLYSSALAELESVGFVTIDRRSGDDVAILVLAPLQVYLEDLENQGTDDF